MSATFAKAAVMTKAGSDMEIQEFRLPATPPGAALVRVACCTICRSDLHTWLGRRPGPAPAILGHEIVGTIAELGEGLAHDSVGRPLRLGDRVTWTLHSSCGSCRNCRELQLPMKCVSLRKYGHDSCLEPPHLRGGFAEYCLVDAGSPLIRLPDHVSDRVAAPANCAIATIVAGWEAAGLRPGARVLIQGAGALGCYAAAYAAHAGAAQIIISDVREDRLQYASRFG
ncbi:MAG: alcohol dehydrogenase catalytic domain-containing protein, partial [Planctomycetales bacterium]|nr:alcohol dehydrogenase catalytic domain-containing protein [Planctomycetales bacterium]